MRKGRIIKDIKSNIAHMSTIIKYSSKCKKLGITQDLLNYLSYRTDTNDEKEVLEIIRKSKNRSQLQNYISELVLNNPRNFYIPTLLVGNVVGTYTLFEYYKYDGKIDYLDNFKLVTNEKVIEVLKKNFYDYVMNDNSVKNRLYKLINNVKDFTSEVTDDIEMIFDNVLMNVETDEHKRKVVQEYIFLIMKNYPLDYILTDYDFIKYDLQSSESGKLEDRKAKYDKYKNLDTESIHKISNIENLKSKLGKINNTESLELLRRLMAIEDYHEKIEDINDIYLEYELLLRKDLLNHLFVPTATETIIDDFRTVKPQLIHCFMRNPEKLRKKLEEQIVKRVIAERNVKNESEELTNEELERVKRLYNRLEAEITPVKVNYSFDSTVGVYSDTTGLGMYKSDTNNQISASVYSSNYFNTSYSEMLGIGFNIEGLQPEAIVLSAPTYMTTNKGLNNVEYDPRKEFNLMSSCYEELIENDGQSEVVLFRRNIDYDTKAAYVFVAYDKQNNEDYMKLIERGREIAQKNNLKLVLYDMAKIRASYKQHIAEEQDYTNEKGPQL